MGLDRADCQHDESRARVSELLELLHMEYLEGESGYVGLIPPLGDTSTVTTHVDSEPLAAQSQIHYMLTEEFPLNALHWLASCDTHILLEGGPVDYYIFKPDGSAEMLTLGDDTAAGQTRVVPVPSNCFKALQLHAGAPYALMVNCLSPGWTPERVRIGAGEEFLLRYSGSAPWATSKFLRELIGPNFAPASPIAVSKSPMQGAASATPLRFVSEALSVEENAELVATFRRQGWCCLRNVFRRDTVAEFRQQILSKLQPPGTNSRWTVPSDAPELVAPVLAPRIRAFIPQLLTPAHPRGDPSHVQLFELAWQGEPGPLEAQGWHRDRSGGAIVSGDASTPEEDCYRFPEAVHCTAYYRDMDIDSAGPAPGSTEILSGSHLDASCPRPTSGIVGGWQAALEDCNADVTTHVPTECFAPRAEDVIVWDQRLWHRRGAFVPHGSPDDRRLMSIFGFHQTQVNTNNHSYHNHSYHNHTTALQDALAGCADSCSSFAESFRCFEALATRSRMICQLQWRRSGQGRVNAVTTRSPACWAVAGLRNLYCESCENCRRARERGCNAGVCTASPSNIHVFMTFINVIILHLHFKFKLSAV